MRWRTGRFRATATIARMFDEYSRDELRRAYVEAWRRHVAGLPLSALQALIANVLSVHPEYHALLQSAEAAVGFEAHQAPGAPHANPFLHLGLHVAVREQIGLDRPPGLLEPYRRLVARLGTHGAEHVLMDALEKELAQAQASGRAPDEAAYVNRVREAADTRSPG